MSPPSGWRNSVLCSSSAGDCEVLSHISNEHSPHSRNALACLDGVKQLLYLNSYYLNSYVFSSEEAVFFVWESRCLFTRQPATKRLTGVFCVLTCCTPQFLFYLLNTAVPKKRLSKDPAEVNSPSIKNKRILCLRFYSSIFLLFMRCSEENYFKKPRLKMTKKRANQFKPILNSTRSLLETQWNYW